MAARATPPQPAAAGAPRGGLVSLCITQTTGWGLLYYSLPAAVLPISEDTGWDPALVTGSFSAGLLVSALAGIRVGRVLDRTGPRTLMVSGSLVGVLALVLVSLAPNLPLFAAAWLLAGTAQAATLYQPAFTVISRWYGRDRVRPLTTLTLVAGFASTIFVPFTASLTAVIGWRSTFLALAALLGLVTVPLHARFLNRTWPPEAHPARPDDDRLRVLAITRSPEFLGLQALMVLLCLGLFTVTLNIIPLLMEKGAGYATAAMGLGLVGAGQVGGRLLFASIPARARVATIAGAGAVTVLSLAVVPGPPGLLIAAGVLAGAVRGCQTLLQATIVAERWGMSNLGALQGRFAAPLTAVMALAPAAGPALAAWLGSYTGMAYAMAGAAGLAAVTAGALLSVGPASTMGSSGTNATDSTLLARRKTGE